MAAAVLALKKIAIQIAKSAAKSAASSENGKKTMRNVLIGVFVAILLLLTLGMGIIAAPGALLLNYFSGDRVASIDTAVSDYKLDIAPVVGTTLMEQVGKYPYPLKGTLTSGYGWRTYTINERSVTDNHRGIDISTGKNDPIISIADGVIATKNVDPDGYGLYLLIKHDDGFYTLSAHLSKAYVKVGDKVTQGQTIALEGGGNNDANSGSSTGTHLHFEVRKTAYWITKTDPITFLNKL